MFRFPLWLGLLGTVLPIVTLLEGLLPLFFLAPVPIRPSDWDRLAEFWSISARYGVAVGVALGLLAVAFSAMRHGRAGAGNAARFGANLGWCLGLASAIVSLNDAVFFVVVKAFGWTALLRSGPLFPLQLFPLLLAIVLHSTALIWAIIRSIATDDVLSPRVLLAKIRRSAQLLG